MSKIVCLFLAVLVVASLSTALKSSWPELSGSKGEAAKAYILKERPDLRRVEIIREGSAVTMDYRLDRVRIFVDDAGFVVGVPRTG